MGQLIAAVAWISLAVVWGTVQLVVVPPLVRLVESGGSLRPARTPEPVVVRVGRPSPVPVASRAA